MLTGLHVVFIGGDARQLEVIQKFYEMDATITLVGFDQLENKFAGVKKERLSEQLLSTADVILLPPIGTDDKGNINSVFSGEDLQLSEKYFKSLAKHCSIYTGIAKPYLKEMCRKHQIKFVELLARDDVAIFNSIPTAEGAVMLAIKNTDITIHSSNCIVLGMGRTGITLARVLQGLGANVQVGVRRGEQFARSFEMNLKPFYSKDLVNHVSEVDLLFNTIPSMIITAEVIANMPNRTVIIDLASKPGGTDFRFAEKRGVKAMLAPGLPGIVAPKTAGQIIANCVSEIVMEDYQIWRNAK
ncbi:dipicolinate synthase subunit DpsA [Longirhabdus pacifica]|uniref:dipicolinate synthase subunit DpsA n=1 Tax=Longirhabdus pacifica TaxID=2305227 RepID=UPI0010091061|nr:dipicolinate synthase subunit DpsA [Longirhabdus pacifica]